MSKLHKVLTWFGIMYGICNCMHRCVYLSLFVNAFGFHALPTYFQHGFKKKKIYIYIYSDKFLLWCVLLNLKQFCQKKKKRKRKRKLYIYIYKHAIIVNFQVDLYLFAEWVMDQKCKSHIFAHVRLSTHLPSYTMYLLHKLQ